MSYNIKWLTRDHIDDVTKLSRFAYQTNRDTYPIILDSASQPFKGLMQAYFPRSDVTNSNNRRAIGVFDLENNLIAATGVRTMSVVPAWTLSWTISRIKTAAFLPIWQLQIETVLGEFEQYQLNEFYVISPVAREHIYKKMMRFLRTKYWTFIDRTVPAGNRPTHQLHWELMGYQLPTTDVNIRKYILKRGDNV